MLFSSLLVVGVGNRARRGRTRCHVEAEPTSMVARVQYKCANLSEISAVRTGLSRGQKSRFGASDSARDRDLTGCFQRKYRSRQLLLHADRWLQRDGDSLHPQAGIEEVHVE